VFHLFEELALARLLRRQVQAKSKLLHGFRSCKARACFADVP
jgi:hypothetical protein